jgi:hypothetical protein
MGLVVAGLVVAGLVVEWLESEAPVEPDPQAATNTRMQPTSVANRAGLATGRR